MEDKRTETECRDRLSSLAISTERLLVSTENLEKVVQRHQDWIDNHDEHYHDLKFDVASTKQVIQLWSERVESLQTSVEKMADKIASLIETGLKIKGGWMFVTAFGSLFMGAVAVLKAFGVI